MQKMNKPIVIVALAVLGLVILVKSGIVDSLVLFLLVGAIPGTDYSIPSGVMLLALIGLIWIVVFRFMAIETFYTIVRKRAAKKIQERKKRLPKRRFSQV